MKELISDPLHVITCGGMHSAVFLSYGDNQQLLGKTQHIGLFWSERKLDDGRFTHYQPAMCTYSVDIPVGGAEFAHRVSGILEWIGDNMRSPWCFRRVHTWYNEAPPAVRFSFADEVQGVDFALRFT